MGQGRGSLAGAFPCETLRAALVLGSRVEGLAAGSGGFVSVHGGCASRGRGLGSGATGQNPAKIRGAAATLGHPATLRWLGAEASNPSAVNGMPRPEKRGLVSRGSQRVPSARKLSERLPSFRSCCRCIVAKVNRGKAKLETLH
jgi:hypothetical protein